MAIKLLVVQGRPLGKSLLFPCGDYYFGRGPECHVRPESEWVSRQHCLLRVTPTGVFVRDLGSRNGTLVNGALLEKERQLMHGDQVQIGPLVFEVQLELAPASGPPSLSANDAGTLGTESTAEMDVSGPDAAKLEPGPKEEPPPNPKLPPEPSELAPSVRS